MANTISELHVLERTRTGKGAARQARREGLVPGVVYGDGKTPLAISVPFNELVKRLRAGHFLATMMTLKIEGKPDIRVICREVQRDVVKDLPTHVDFMRVRASSRITIMVPVEIVGEEECPGIRKGGVLTLVRPEVELEVSAGNIPEKLVVNLAGLDIGDHVSISGVELPEGAEPTVDRDFMIASITPPSGMEAEVEEAEEATEVPVVPRKGEIEE